MHPHAFPVWILRVAAKCEHGSILKQAQYGVILHDDKCPFPTCKSLQEMDP